MNLKICFITKNYTKRIELEFWCCSIILQVSQAFGEKILSDLLFEHVSLNKWLYQNLGCLLGLLVIENLFKIETKLLGHNLFSLESFFFFKF